MYCAVENKTNELPRRTQKERRDKTRAALLDAAVEALVSLGYANTSTLEVQKRAGVSRGALLHHYPSKASLMADVVRYLAELRGRELQLKTTALPSGADRIDLALDLLWESFSGALFTVAMELRIAARTDAELRKELIPTELELHQNITTQFTAIFGEQLASRPGFLDALNLTVHCMVGLAMSAMIHNDQERLSALLQQQKNWLRKLLIPNQER
jgi:AcrR family transcriptional regulator